MEKGSERKFKTGAGISNDTEKGLTPAQRTRLMREFKTLKARLFNSGDFQAYDAKDGDWQRYDSLLGLFFPQFRTAGWTCPAPLRKSTEGRYPDVRF